MASQEQSSSQENEREEEKREEEKREEEKREEESVGKGDPSIEVTQVAPRVSDVLHSTSSNC